MTVSVVDAKNRLCELLERVEKGERIVICRHGRPVVDLVPTGEPELPKKKRALDLDAWIRGGL